MGDRWRYLEAAIEQLGELSHTTVRKRSDVYETEPVGDIPQDWYLNQAVEILTGLEPLALLQQMQAIETRLGRKRDGRWNPRTLDLDLLLYDDRCLTMAGLIIPHPQMHERRFVLEPLCQIAPEAWHPRLKCTVQQLLQHLTDTKQVRCIPDAPYQRNSKSGGHG